ncbi:MAG TPA: heavy metal-binding domain-containing protein [Hanamia sp.]|nr:heavy metal-binding domain-containing protein [Hanamia sp.]
MSLEKCPNCGKSLSGFLSAELLSQSKTDFLNKHLKENKEGYCSSCYKQLLKKIASTFEKQKAEIEKRLQQIIHHIPILTSPAPVRWEYEVIGMVNAQTTAGTGFTTELSRSFNDLFGATSNASNRKIARATNLCKSDLRVQAVQVGGNAIVSTDIDFNEVGSGSTNMLMVCMAGTAIKVTDMSNFNPKTRETIGEIIELTEQLESIAEVVK